MKPTQILDGCDHGNAAKKFTDPDDICRLCAERAIAAAVEAETERCAIVAAQEAVDALVYEGMVGEPHFASPVAGRIAAAIRARGGK